MQAVLRVQGHGCAAEAWSAILPGQWGARTIRLHATCASAKHTFSITWQTAADCVENSNGDDSMRVTILACQLVINHWNGTQLLTDIMKLSDTPAARLP